MTRYRRTALGAIATLGLALAASAAIAHSGGGGMHGTGMGGMHAGMHGQGGQGEGMHRGMHGAGMGGGAQLMTPEERDSLREKMRAASTPQERQAIAAATRAEMEKRAKDQGVALPEQRGPGVMGRGQGRGTDGAMGGMGGTGGHHRH